MKLIPGDISPPPLSEPWLLDNNLEVHALLPGVESRNDKESVRKRVQPGYHDIHGWIRISGMPERRFGGGGDYKGH